MSREYELIGALMLAASLASVTACQDGITGPDISESETPVELAAAADAINDAFGGLLLADPRPSPWSGADGMGIQIDLEVAKEVFEDDVKRYAFRTTAWLTDADGKTSAVDPKIDPAEGVLIWDVHNASKVSPESTGVSLFLESRQLADILAKAAGPVLTQVQVELHDVWASQTRVLDRVRGKAILDY